MGVTIFTDDELDRLRQEAARGMDSLQAQQELEQLLALRDEDDQ